MWILGGESEMVVANLFGMLLPPDRNIRSMNYFPDLPFFYCG